MRIGVFCSGGDAPGMNACLRAVVRSAVSTGHEVVGIRRGYQGVLDEDFFINRDGASTMTLRAVSDLSKLGGTILRTSRSEAFRDEAGQRRAAAVLDTHGIDALVPIGGDGTFRGAAALARHWNGRIVGCPGTIDNDLLGTDKTIGFSTAVQTAVEAVDKIRDTADSHQRAFLIEVMGRHSGYIALYTALAAGAECVCIPETSTDIKELTAQIEALKQRGKSSIMLVVAEGNKDGGADALNEQLKKAGCAYPTRVVVLGHLQRGGAPTPEDRILASRLGDFAVRSIVSGESGMMAGVVGGRCVLTLFDETVAGHKPIPADLLQLLDTLSK